MSTLSSAPHKLVIAEKPSVASEISKVIGATKKENGYYSGNGYYVSWCVGHLIKLADPEEYDATLKKWSFDTLPIIPEKYKTVISEKTASQYKVLESLVNRSDVTELVCATDAGREGELIFRLVYDKIGTGKQFKRLWISSMEEKAIRDGFANLKSSREYDNLYIAARCRQCADWLVGINFTRLYTTKYNKLLKVGRVQTPTINMLVKRHYEIKNFNSRSYYTVVADLGEFSAFSRDIDDKGTADKLALLCKDKIGYVVNILKETKRENPPALYDITTLQREANRMLGYTAQKTLDIVQSLYEKKLTTYPRTDSRYITSDMEEHTRELVGKMVSSNNGVSVGYDINLANTAQIVNDKKVTDHHAIIPTNGGIEIDINALSKEEASILLLTKMRLLSAVYTPHIYIVTKVTVEIENEPFTANGKEIQQDGFKIVEKQIKSFIKDSEKEDSADSGEKDALLPLLVKGDMFTVLDTEVKAKKTQPPRPYTEDTLLNAMETAGKNITDEELKEEMKSLGLGTPATRANIIENIISSGYVQRIKKQLHPTETAISFVELVTDNLKEPDMTAEWEKQLREIETGERDGRAFMRDISEYVKSLVIDKGSTPSADTAIFRTKKDSFGTCPVCQNNVVEYSKSYSCESGKDKCGFVIWKSIAGKDISKAQLNKLLTKKKSDLIKGFKGKSGKDFDAHLILRDDNTIGFEFANK